MGCEALGPMILALRDVAWGRGDSLFILYGYLASAYSASLSSRLFVGRFCSWSACNDDFA